MILFAALLFLFGSRYCSNANMTQWKKEDIQRIAILISGNTINSGVRTCDVFVAFEVSAQDFRQQR
eukprot:3529065-Amphidinium_carterae.1